MNAPASPDISLKIVELPVPILKYRKWLEISFPLQNEQTAIESLSANLEKAKELAASTGIHQLKISAPSSWSKLETMGFTACIYHMSIPTDQLPMIADTDADLMKSKNPDSIAKLVVDQFRYHSNADPDYYSHDPDNSAQEFISIASEAIARNNGFLILASVEDTPVGFLYCEHDTENGTLDELFIDEKYRKKGYGTALLSASRYTFGEVGSKAVDVYVSSKTPAPLFYDARGFTKEAINWIINLE